MGKKRVKVAVPEKREDVERLVGEVCRLSIEADERRARMDEQLLAVRRTHEPKLARLAEELNSKLAVAQAWADAHPEEFATRRSVVFVHGVLGYRTGQPRLKTLKGWTWKLVLERLKPMYVRTKREPDKELLLANRNEIGAEGFAEVGLQVVQDESFFVEPNREPATTPAA